MLKLRRTRVNKPIQKMPGEITRLWGWNSGWKDQPSKEQWKNWGSQERTEYGSENALQPKAPPT
eukprot:8603607-Prorocentrum_lima.AAC.1